MTGFRDDPEPLPDGDGGHRADSGADSGRGADSGYGADSGPARDTGYGPDHDPTSSGRGPDACHDHRLRSEGGPSPELGSDHPDPGLSAPGSPPASGSPSALGGSASVPGSPPRPFDLGERLPGPEPVELLQPAVEVLPVPPGSFERVRRRANRRRLARTAAGGGLAAAVVAGSLFLIGVPGMQLKAAPPATASSSFPSPQPSSGTGVQKPSPTPPASSPSASASPTNGSSGGVGGSGVQATVVPQPSQGAAGVTGGGGSYPMPTSTPTPGAATSAPTCATSQLTASLGGSDAGAGNVYRYLLLTNHSGSSCEVTGFPGLSLLNAQGGEIGAPATFDHSFAYTPVVLTGGQTASATIHTLNSGATSCQGTSTSLRIYPPDNTASLLIPGQVMLCGNQLSVSPFTAGSTGNPPS